MKIEEILKKYNGRERFVRKRFSNKYDKFSARDLSYLKCLFSIADKKIDFLSFDILLVTNIKEWRDADDWELFDEN